MMDLVQLERNPVPLIGRRAELDELERVLGGVRPGAVLLAGDAGVGKTRLLAEFRAGLVDGGTQVLIGHCVDFGDAAPPYLPFAELFSRGATERPELAAVLSEHHPPWPGWRSAEATDRPSVGMIWSTTSMQL